MVRSSRINSSARWIASGFTNRGPPRRGEAAASRIGTTIAADSGSRSPVIRVIPSDCLTTLRYRLSRNACSRSAIPARSSSSRTRAARIARFSTVNPGAAAISATAASCRASPGTSLVCPSRVRMISAASTEIAADATAAPIAARHPGTGGVGGASSRAGVGSSSAAFTRVGASRRDPAVTFAIRSSADRTPWVAASPVRPSSRRERCAISPANTAATASTRRRSSATARWPSNSSASANPATTGTTNGVSGSPRAARKDGIEAMPHSPTDSNTHSRNGEKLHPQI